MQTWYRPHPYGVYPRGNARDPLEITHRFGTLSGIIHATTSDDKEHTELPYIELMQTILSFVEVPDLCHLSRVCTGFYVMVHCTDAFKTAYTQLCPERLRFHHSWKETAIRGYLASQGAAVGDTILAEGHGPSDAKRRRLSTEKEESAAGSTPAPHTPGEAGTDTLPCHRIHHTPIMLGRRYFCDQLFQAWMCTILPLDYHLHPVRPAGAVGEAPNVGHSRDASGRDVLQLQKRPRGDSKHATAAAAAALPDETDSCGAAFAHEEAKEPMQYRTDLLPVPRCAGLSADAFRERFEKPNKPVVLTGIATEWPLFKILNGRFNNLSDRKAELVRDGCPLDAPLRCEYTDMSLDEYVRYANEQTDERPIYMFAAEFWRVLDTEKLYTVPDHFARDDFFSVLGEERRPKHRWIIAGPARGGSGFHLDPNYTNAWNANMTGRKRWLLFPPSAAPPGCVPSADMSEVATPLSLTEWLLNFYDSSVEQLRHVGYECICEPGDIMFVPCGWWHSVVNLEDSIAITHNYVSSSNLTNVLKFLRAMKGSISGINEDSDDVTEEAVARRRQHFADEFASAMRARHPEVMRETEAVLAKEREDWEKKHNAHLALLESNPEGFQFDF